MRTVAGSASYPTVLEAAGIVDTDILVALTSSDEVNIVACEIAHALYRTPTRIARIRASEYTSREKLFADGMIAVDVSINPEQLVTEYVERLIHNPGALQVVVSVRERSVREIKAFAWSDQASAYVETPLEQA